MPGNFVHYKQQKNKVTFKVTHITLILMLCFQIVKLLWTEISNCYSLDIFGNRYTSGREQDTVISGNRCLPRRVHLTAWCLLELFTSSLKQKSLCFCLGFGLVFASYVLSALSSVYPHLVSSLHCPWCRYSSSACLECCGETLEKWWIMPLLP